jgi:hypothetical protein
VLSSIASYSQFIYTFLDEAVILQEHPNDPDLASSFPHHKHVPPDPSTGSGQSIKRHRIPAPELSFAEPNLPFLIREIEALLKG